MCMRVKSTAKVKDEHVSKEQINTIETMNNKAKHMSPIRRARAFFCGETTLTTFTLASNTLGVLGEEYVK